MDLKNIFTKENGPKDQLGDENSMNVSMQIFAKKEYPSNICPSHEEEANLVCLVDSCRMCRFCEHSGEHKGHKIKTIEEIQKIASGKIEDLQRVVNDCLSYRDTLKRIGFDDVTDLVSMINKRFDRLRDALNDKQKKLISELHDYVEYKNSYIKGVLDSEVDFPGDLAEKVEKLRGKEVDRIFLEELKAALPDCQSKTEYLLLKRYNSLFGKDELEKRLESLEVFFRMKIEKFTLPSSIQNFSKYMKNTFLQTRNNKQYLDGKGLLSFQKDDEKVYIALQNSGFSSELELENVRDLRKVVLDLTNYAEVEKKTTARLDETYVILDILGQRLKKGTTITLKLKIGEISSEEVLRLLNCDFWKNKALKKKFEANCCSDFNLSESSFMEISTKILPKIKALRFLLLDFTASKKFTDKCFETLVSTPELQKLNYLELRLNETPVTDKIMHANLGNLKSLKVFKLYLWSTQITDKGLADFSSQTLPVFMNLEHLELNVGKCPVSDIGVSCLFSHLTRIKILRIGLWNTKISEKSVEVFSNQTLPRLSELNQLELSLGDTEISNQRAAELLMKIDNKINIKIYLNDGVNISDYENLRDAAEGSYGFLKRLKNKLLFG